MYTGYFGLDENPFSITPDPRYLFLGARHSEALAHLLFGIREGNGFIQLTGEVGTGKTTLTRCLLDELPEHIDVAFILNPRQDVEEFLRNICDELDITTATNAGAQAMINALYENLLATYAAGRRTVLIIDEAQNLSPELLEQIRLLTNLETAKHKLLQILLIGQPELRVTLARTDLRQLAQRITARYHLEPLSRIELDQYIRHRLEVAGASGPIFTRSALRRIWQFSTGIPRIVNILCDRALLAAYTHDRRKVDGGLITRAAKEALAVNTGTGFWRWSVLVMVMIVILGAGAMLWRPVPPPDVPGPAADLGGWLRAQSASTGSRNALQQLFDTWQLRLDPVEPACRQATAQGFACLYEKTSWRGLRELNLPAVLDLVDERGRHFQLLARSMRDDRVTLTTGHSEYTSTAGELSQYWSGELLVLWQPPFAQDKLLAEGSSGEEVRWLKAGLQRLLPDLPQTASDQFDAELAAAVRVFQASEGLRVDGIAGARTLIRLNTRLGRNAAPALLVE